jgi:hypothetical protein
VRILPVSLHGSRSVTKSRLTHRIAALFGVDLGETPATWATRYTELTIAEIARGGLFPSRAWHQASHQAWRQAHHANVPLGESPLLPQGTWFLGGRGLLRGTGSDGVLLADVTEVRGSVNVMSPATMSRFGPDSKAALVLAGANEAFESLVPVFAEIIALMRATQPGLGKRTTLSLWALMVLECYRSQPLLFAAAVTARAIQRALTTAWGPVAGLELPAARAGFHSHTSRDDGSDFDQRELNIMDETLRATGLVFRSGGEGAGEAFLRDEVIWGWAQHLLESHDSGYVWLTEPAAERRSADVLLAHADLVTALGTDTWGRFGQDPSDIAWENLVPLVPGLHAAAGLSPQGQLALVWALTEKLGMLRLNPPAGDRAAFYALVLDRQRELAHLSAALLGPVHPVTYLATLYSLAAQHYDTRHIDPAQAQEAGIGASQAMARLAELCQAGQVTGSFFATAMLVGDSVIRRTAQDAAERGDVELADRLRDDAGWYWGQFFAVLQIDLDAELAAQPDSPKLRALAPHLHEYAGSFLVSSGDYTLVHRGLELLDRFIIPARFELIRGRGTDRRIRTSFQLGIAAADALLTLPEATDDDRHEWPRKAWAYAQWLRELPEVGRTLAKSGPESEWEANTLTRLVTAGILAVEYEVPGASVSLADLRAALMRVAAFRKIDPVDATTARAADDLLVGRLHERLGALEAGLAVAGIGSSVAPHPTDGGVFAVGDGTPGSGAVGGLSVDGGAVAGDEPARRQVELADAGLFEALRGTVRRWTDAWPCVELAWTGDDRRTLVVTMDVPLLSARVVGVTVRISVGATSLDVPLTWEHRPGHPVHLRGFAEGLGAVSLRDLAVQLVVHNE